METRQTKHEGYDDDEEPQYTETKTPPFTIVS